MKLIGGGPVFASLIVLLSSVIIFGLSAVNATATDIAVRCEEVSYIDRAGWDRFRKLALQDNSNSHVTIAGHQFQVIGSVCDLAAERMVLSSFWWEYLSFSDIAWFFFASSELGSAEIYLLKRDTEPIYFWQQKDIGIVVTINNTDGGFVHIVGDGHMIVDADGTVTADAADMEFRAGSLPTRDNQSVSIRILPKAAHMGSSVVSEDGDKIFLNGIIGLETYEQLSHIARRSDTQKTVVFEIVDGTYSFQASAFTGRLIRDAGWNTYAAKTSSIFSGGVDVFLSGNRRIVEKGADFGVHPGCCYAGYDGGELVADHPFHAQLLEYSNEMLGEPMGEEFYNFTNKVVSFDKFRLLSDEDLIHWGVATEIVDPGASAVK